MEKVKKAAREILDELTGNESEGEKEMWKYISGKRLTPNEAIKAKCCLCMTFYMIGERDCMKSDCPLYPFMPYRIN